MNSYHFTKSKDIEKYLLELEAIKINFDNQKTIPEIEEKIRRDSRLKSAVYSAKIEGIDTTDNTKIEIQNLVKAYHQIYQSENHKALSIELIKDLHHKAMQNISNMAGKYRQEPWAIFDESGNVIHLAPSFLKVPQLIQEYVGYINSLSDHPAIISAISQFVLQIEKWQK